MWIHFQGWRTELAEGLSACWVLQCSARCGDAPHLQTHLGWAALRVRSSLPKNAQSHELGNNPTSTAHRNSFVRLQYHRVNLAIRLFALH